MSYYAKILSLSYNSAAATKTVALKTYWRSVRLIKESGTVNPLQDSTITNVLLNGKCIDPETRCLYVFYIDTYYQASWIIEINIDTRAQVVVYYDKYNVIGFNAKYKIYNAKVVHGRLVWTDNFNPIYQMDITRAKKSFELGIGYGQYPNTEEWSAITSYSIDQIVSNGNRYYKSVHNTNVGVIPKTDTGTHWTDLRCLIEDAYYSMNVKNFYFEAVPPKLPPEVTYQSDEARKINNLRQTLFQVAYRYVYMDWRKSTFSPASIVPVPQAEEETATGLASEMISLNNKLQVIVNTGGEEVRAIEVIARSSDDISKWYLIETINKFEAQERGNEISRTSEPEYIGLTATLPITTAEATNEPDAIGKTVGMTISTPDTINSYVSADVTGMGWSAAEGGVAQTTQITAKPTLTRLTSFPSWLTILSGGGLPLSAGMSIQDLEIITVYPTFNNIGGPLSGQIILTTDQGDVAYIAVNQSAPVVIPPSPITPTMAIDPLDTSGLTLIGSSLASLSGSNEVTYSFAPNHPGYSSGQPFAMFWRANVNGNAYGNGSITAYDEVSNTGVFTLNNNLAAGDVVIIYVSAIAVQEITSSKTNMGIVPLLPELINSSVSSDKLGMLWIAAQSGYGDRDTALIGCPPVNCTFIKPDWITVWHGDDVTGYAMYNNWTIQNGETISVFPASNNLGGARSGYIVLTNAYGDTVTIIVSQAAAVAPPSGVPISCTLQVYSGDGTGLTLPGTSASAVSGQKLVNWSALIAHSAHADEIWTMYWRAKVNNIVQGSGSFDAYNGSQGGTIVVDYTLLAGDIVIIDFSSVTF